MRAAMLTPLPPAHTGVAHYASMILPALRRRMEVEAFDHAVDDLDAFDVVFYQLGNNPHHEFAYREALRRPGIAVIHDVVLHHLIVETTLARGDAAAYVEALRANHGEAGAAWAVGRIHGMHYELGNFLFPASVEVANRSRGVIVHNEFARRWLRSLGVRTPISVVPHPFEPVAVTPPQRRDDERVIGMLGYLTATKRSDVVLRAFERARSRDPRLRLLVVGEPAPNIDVAALARDGVTFTGYVSDAEFGGYYGAIDRLVNLRYPTAGETSGTLMRAFAAGIPVAVSDYAQFAELPDDCVAKIPFGPEEAEALANFFTREIDVEAVAAAQQRYLANATVDHAADGYLRALDLEAESLAPPAAHGSLPLFPKLQLVRASTNVIEVRNDGDNSIRTRTYGESGYRLITKVFDAGREIFDRWIELPGDLAPGQAVSLQVTLPRGRLALYHAIEGIPLLEREAWAHAAI